MEDRLIIEPKESQINQRQRINNQNQYASNFQYLCAVIGFAVGYGSFWRFPYLVYQYGSQFVFIYFLILGLFGLPILYLQTALGQIHQESIPFIFGRINKGLKFLGITFIIICFNFSGYYNIILAYSYRFVISVFDSSIRFQDQSIKDNKIFAQNILHSSNSINQFQSINYSLFFFYIFSLAICYYVIAKGVKQSGKIIVFTATFPYLLFIIMLLRGIFLPGAFDGLKLLFQLKGKIFTPVVWFQAITQVFYQLTLACAGIIHMSSMKTKTQQFSNGLYIILGSVLACGMLCAVNIFIYLGHFSKLIGVSIHDITLSGPQLCFNIFPKALAILPFPRIWLFLFFFTMVLLGIDSMIGGMQTIVCYLKDQAKAKAKIFGIQLTFGQMKLALVFGYIIFIFPLTSNAGIHYLVWFDRFSVYIPLAFNIILEIYLFVYKFQFSELQKQVQLYTGTKTPWYVGYFLRSKILIGILLVNFVLTIWNQLVVYFFQYSFLFYIGGWIWTVYPYVIAYWYWQKNKELRFRLTFHEIESTYNKYEYDQRTSGVHSYSVDSQLREIKNSKDINDKKQLLYQIKQTKSKFIPQNKKQNTKKQQNSQQNYKI